MNKSFSLKRAMLAGIIGTAAMTVLMYGWPLLGLPKMDILSALGNVFPLDISPYVMGSLIHFGIGASLGLIYALFFESMLPGPGWLRGALFSLLPWVFAITLLAPSLQMANEFFRGKEAIAANPCAVTKPGAVYPTNPDALHRVQSNPCAPAKVSNPCTVSVNPCAVANPSAGSPLSSSSPSPQVMSLIVHLFFGAVLGTSYRTARA